MKRLLLAATVAAMAVTTAQAQTTTPAPQAPAAQPAPDAQHPPTNRMDKTVPDMKHKAQSTHRRIEWARQFPR